MTFTRVFDWANDTLPRTVKAKVVNRHDLIYTTRHERRDFFLISSQLHTIVPPSLDHTYEAIRTLATVLSWSPQCRRDLWPAGRSQSWWNTSSFQRKSTHT